MRLPTQEIHSRGPITCEMAADLRFLFNYSSVVKSTEGVYTDPIPHGEDEIDHDVSVTGWGVTASGVKYWIVRNSWCMPPTLLDVFHASRAGVG